MSVKGVILVSVIVAVIAVVLVKIYPNYPSGHIGVLFYYCTSSHKDRKELKATKEGVVSLPVNPSTPVTIVIHGYTESSIRSWVVNLTDALLAHDPKSVVILVDYWDLTTISRPYMMDNVRHIADVTAHLIDLLVERKDVRFLHQPLGKYVNKSQLTFTRSLPPMQWTTLLHFLLIISYYRLTNVHVMGFSLGGRISGLVGDRIQTGTLGRITGLDASYPWLSPRTNAEFLDAGDAALVVNIRTSPVGSLSPPGHIDFLANGGLSQPGCQYWYLPETVKQICSHYRAVWLMVEAVKHAGQGVFPACRCPDWESFQDHGCDCHIVNNFGLSPNTSALGNFFFSTYSVPPYSKPL